jgi:hypothetical protein
VSGPATLADFRAHVEALYRRIGKELRSPDADWPACVLVVQTPKGVDLARVPPEFLEHGYQKTIVRAVLVEALRTFGGVFRFALVLNVHGVALKTDARGNELRARIEAEELRVEDLPEAREYLWLVVGDAETEEVWRAEVRRDERRPPTLSSWRDLSNDPETTAISGRFTGFSEALR